MAWRGLAWKLDNLICQCSNVFVLDVEVIQSPQAAAAALDPVRARLLAELSEPASAATLAARLSLPRPKSELPPPRPWKATTPRMPDQRTQVGAASPSALVEATASSYVVSPAAMGPAASSPERSRDRLSAGYLIALAARVIREASELAARARRNRQAPRHALDRYRDPLPLGRGARAIQQRTYRRDHSARGSLS